MERRFKTGQDLANFVKHYIGKEIKVDDTFKEKRGISYMEIPNSTPIWSELNRLGIKTESHIGNKYFVYLVQEDNMGNLEAIKTNFDKYVEMYKNKFNETPRSWFTYLKWLADCNKGHTFQPNETKLAIELFERLVQHG